MLCSCSPTLPTSPSASPPSPRRSRSHERARLDVALLFGTLALAVALQEIRLLSCAFGSCVDLPFSTPLTTILVLILPYALLRLVDDINDIPPWQMWAALVLLIGIGAVFALSGATPPGWLVLMLTPTSPSAPSTPPTPSPAARSPPSASRAAVWPRSPGAAACSPRRSCSPSWPPRAPAQEPILTPHGAPDRPRLGSLLLGRLLPAPLAQPDVAAARAPRLPAADDV